MFAHRMGLAVLAGLVLFAPLAHAQALTRRDVLPLRPKPGAQPDLLKILPFSRDRDALGVFRVAVGADGAITSAELIDGFYSERQAAQLKRAVNSLVFLPMSVDGQARPATIAVPIRSFRTPPPAPVTSDVRARLRRAAGLVDSREYAAAMAKLDEIPVEEIRSWPAYRAIAYLRARALAAEGRLHEALRQSHEASKYPISPSEDRDPTIRDALQMKLALEKSLGLVGEALDTAATLKPRRKPDEAEKAEEEVASLQRLVAGNEPIPATLRIDAYGKAALKLVRPRIDVDYPPAGAVTEAWVSCGSSTTLPVDLAWYAVPLDLPSWERPDSPQECRVEFTGMPGAALRVVQSRP